MCARNSSCVARPPLLKGGRGRQVWTPGEGAAGPRAGGAHGLPKSSQFLYRAAETKTPFR